MTEKAALRPGRLYPYFFVTLFSLAMLVSTGCNLCCPPYLDDYATVGGKWSRANPTEGRVGSAFSDPGVLTASAEVAGYPEVDGVVPEVLMSESGVIIEDEAMEDAPIILGDGW